MTEAEWEAASDPNQLLEILQYSAGRRKLCWLCDACCRRLWHLLEAPILRKAIVALECFADIGMDEISARAAGANTHLLRAYREEMFSPNPCQEILSAAYAINRAVLGSWTSPWKNIFPHLLSETQAIQETLDMLALVAARAARDASYPVRPCKGERAAQAHLIREIFGNPFRPTRFVPADMPTAVIALARAAYETHSPEGTLDRALLAVLADALEEAGCTDSQILAHCRGSTTHYRGCWVVDLLLSQE